MLNFSDARSYGMVFHTFRLTYSPANDVFSVVFDMFENKQKIIYIYIYIYFQLLYFIRSVKFYNGTTNIFSRIVVRGCLPHLFLHSPT